MTDKVSNIVSITGIPKTATMDQVFKQKISFVFMIIFDYC